MGLPENPTGWLMDFIGQKAQKKRFFNLNNVALTSAKECRSWHTHKQC
jgi:hypothetical protein